ncbi:MAG: hypothetical protein IJZ28_03915 [Clostridia bacterium]|nr:hypothetical protein [Clostridia bacterium]MBQ8772328.1 hypothetical protein [Clostridia bacterium]
MNKRLFSFLLIIGIVILLFSCHFVSVKEVHSITIYKNSLSNPYDSYTSNIYSYDSFLVSYFDNLTQNFGYNYKGTCGYVAIGMLLSYYDTFYDDNIIPEQYDVVSLGTGTNMITRRNSPGVVRDYIVSPYDSTDITYGFDLTAEEYFAEMQDISDTSLHAKLITLGEELGYYNYDNDDGPGGITLGIQLVNILNKYLTEIRDYTQTVAYTIYPGSGTTHESIRNWVIFQLRINRPVILMLRNSDNKGHVVIAYDYDESTDSIYCHFGWDAGRTHINPETTEYNIFVDAYIVDWQGAHLHSNNYGVTSMVNGVTTTNYYCYDNPAIHTYHLGENGHVCITGTNNGNGTHTGLCACGQTTTESHWYAEDSYSNITNTTHKQTCAVCGYNTVVPHLWRVINKTVTGHVKQCNCGHTVDEVHTWVQNALGGYICSVCRQTSNFTPGIQSLLTPAGRLALQAANLQHGQVALIEGLPIIYFNGEYYLLSDSTTQVPYPIPPALQTE